jgi:2-polyprenyl-3-methyl-5-hydroxy-6-metoxy-1,4-benzoquinol methylase
MSNTTTDNWSASNYVKHASFVPKLGNVILNMLDPQPFEEILDFGCGDGVLSKELALRCKSVIGIDASPDMIVSANKQESKPENIQYFTVNGYELDNWFDQQSFTQFDAVFSSATLHWLKEDPVKAIKNIRHVLKPEGRFVAEFGGFMNCGGKVVVFPSCYNWILIYNFYQKSKQV